MAKLTTGYDGYLVYPHYRHHPEILQPLEHTTVRVKVELAEPVPDGMVGTLHLAWYDPDNTLANEPDVPPAHNDHGWRDNAEDVELIGYWKKGSAANGTVAFGREQRDSIDTDREF
jgi:hypothetical protein